MSITQNRYTQLAVLCQWMQVVKQVVPVSCKRSQIHLNSLIHPIPADRRQFLNGRIFVSQRSEWLSPCHHVHQVFSGLAAQHRFLQFDICTSAGTSLYIFVYSEYYLYCRQVDMLKSPESARLPFSKSKTCIGIMKVSQRMKSSPSKARNHSRQNNCKLKIATIIHYHVYLRRRKS